VVAVLALIPDPSDGGGAPSPLSSGLRIRSHPVPHHCASRVLLVRSHPDLGVAAIVEPSK
jgi:hypothetical protein